MSIDAPKPASPTGTGGAETPPAPTGEAAPATSESAEPTPAPSEPAPTPEEASKAAAKAAADLKDVEKTESESQTETSPPSVRVTSLPPPKKGEPEGENVVVLNVGDTRASAQLNNPGIAEAAAEGVEVTQSHVINLSATPPAADPRPQTDYEKKSWNPPPRLYDVQTARYGRDFTYETPRPISPPRDRYRSRSHYLGEIGTHEPPPTYSPRPETESRRRTEASRSTYQPTYESFIMSVTGVHDMGTDNKSRVLVKDADGNVVRTIALEPGDSRFQLDLLSGSEYTFEVISGGEGTGETGQDQRDNFQVKINRPPDETSAGEKTEKSDETAEEKADESKAEAGKPAEGDADKTSDEGASFDDLYS